jgi:hypothetical protein
VKQEGRDRMSKKPMSALSAWAVTVCLGGSGLSAQAADLTITSIEVVQAVQYGTTKLIGGNVTWVRVKVGTGGVAMPGVDAALRLTIDGVPKPPPGVPPVFSVNGPITAPATPNLANINDTVNFAVIPPVSTNVMFTVEVNPNRSVLESDYDNNVLSVTKAFECRKVLEVAYVPINYTFNGAGLPPENLIEPGVGDNFLRGIYKPGEWNYHKAPLPPLNWTQDINGSNSLLLNTLADIRNTQLPAAGQTVPDFIYGWLPGNPYSGNGQAGGIPSNRAFGNSELTRFQRTFAHELGHCFGLSHNTSLTNIVGVDVEWHLWNTQSLPQIFPTTKKDIMYAGQLTNAAWVNSNSFNTMVNDSRAQCSASDEAALGTRVPVLRVSGVIENATRNVTMAPVMRFALGEPTANDAHGDTVVVAFDAAGNELHRVTVRTDSNRELCVEHQRGGQAMLDATSALYVLLPETIGGQAIARLEVIDAASGRVTAQRSRSARIPQATLASAMLVPEAADGQAVALRPGDAINGRLRLSWDVADADDDLLEHTLLYSPDEGQSWWPVIVNSREAEFEFDVTAIPASRGAVGIFRLVSSDGLNVTETDSPAYQLSGANPPATYLLTPNVNSAFAQHAPVAFHGSSWDLEDGMLSGDQLVWTSSIDGVIGAGQVFIHSNLSPGTHTITLTGTDTSDQSSSKAVTVTITPRTVISPDCNNNGVLDAVDISNGTSVDGNANSVPDECEGPSCISDVNGDDEVNIDDLLAVINAWGAGGIHPADIDGSGLVDIDDLLAVVNAWGACR